MLRARAVRGVVFAAVILAAALLLTRTLRRGRVPRFDYYAGPLTEAGYQTLASRPGWLAQRFVSSDGTVLRGLERQPKNPGNPWILFFAPNSATLLEDSQRFLDGLLRDADWGASVWAYRGFDGNAGNPSPDALVEDGWQEYQFLRHGRATGGAQVHIVSFSLGTSIAAAVAARASADTPATLTWIAPLVEVDVRPLETPFGAHRYSTLVSIDALQGPVLIVHGSADTQLPVEGGRRLATRLGSRAHYVELSGLGHLETFRAEATQNAIRDFIAANRH